jgi:hypothetical protein
LAVGVSESSASGNQNIADGTYNWRKAVVKSASTAAASADNSLVVGLSPNSPLPKGNNLIGSILSTNDEFGNFQNPTVRLINGVWTLTVKDDLNREFHERNTIALEALVDIENNRLNPAVLSSVPATSDLGYVVRHAGPIPMFQDYTGTGSISALNQFTLLQVNGISSIIINIIGTWVGTLTFQYTVDGITWLSATGQITTGTFVSTTAANGTFRFSAGSYRQFRVVATAWTSGQATIYYNASAGINLITSQSIITDGSNNGPAAVKAASTAAAAADPSLVVALSPNSMKAASTAPVAADTALVVALSPNTFPIVGAAPKTNVIPIAGTDINNTISAISTLTSNGAVKLQVNEDNLRILLEQMLLVLIDIRSSLVASDLKGEAVSMSNIDTNNGN